MTLRTRYYLECDQCGNPFPAVGISPALVDGALVTIEELRRDARCQGWVRRIGLCARDLCPGCVARSRPRGRLRARAPKKGGS